MTKCSLHHGWRTVKFGDLAESITERVDDPKAAGVEIYVGLEHLDSDTTKISRFGTPEDVESTKLRFYPGDVIYARRRAYQRKLGVAEVEGICSAHALVLRARREVCLPEFLPYFLQSDQFHERALSISVGSLSPTINWKTLVVQEFVLPPIGEQHRIVAALKLTDDCVEAISAAKNDLRNLSRIWASDAFSAVALKNDMRRLEDVAEVVMGRQLSPSKRLGNRPLRYLRAANVSPSGIDLQDVLEMDFTTQEENSFKSRIDDVLLVEGGNEKSVGCPARITVSSEELCIQNTLIRCRTKNLRVLDPVFMYHLLKFNFDHGTFAKMCAGTTIMHLGQKRLAKLLVPVPTVAEQRLLAQKLDMFDKTESLLDLQLQHVSIFRKVLLQSLSTGSYQDV
jgi:type I restriction enzyme S subunit